MRKTILMALAAAMIPAMAMAQPYGGGPGGQGMRGPGGQGGKGPRMAQELGLTADQMNKVREIHQKNRKAMIDQKAEIQKAMIDLTGELQKENPDQATLDKAIERIVKVKAEIERARLNTMVETAAILTPEQKKKAAESMAGASFMGGHRGGQGGTMGSGPGGPGGGPMDCPDCPYHPGGPQGGAPGGE